MDKPNTIQSLGEPQETLALRFRSIPNLFTP